MKQAQVRPSKRVNAGLYAFDNEESPYSKWHICVVTRCFARTWGGR